MKAALASVVRKSKFSSAMSVQKFAALTTPHFAESSRSAPLIFSQVKSRKLTFVFFLGGDIDEIRIRSEARRPQDHPRLHG